MTEMTRSFPDHGGQLGHIAERFGIPRSQLLDFSANINPEGPPEAVLSTLRASLGDLRDLTSYPDLEESALKQAIARYAGVPPQSIVVANGFVPLLDAALRALAIRRCLLPVPAFIEYRNSLTRAEVEITPFVLTPESDFDYDTERMVTGQHDAILLANPQNPSGVLSIDETLLRLAARARERNVSIFLDEAFIDYLPEGSLTRAIDRFPNLIVFRSVTKFYGIPGLRAAYAAACPELARTLDRSLPPWLITTLASRAVSAALEDEPYASRTRVLNLERRSLLQTQIESLGIHTYPSAANFLLLRLPAHLDAGTFWERMIVEHHIVLRSCANYEALPGGHLRAAVRNDQENARLVEALSRLLAALRKPILRAEPAVQLNGMTRRSFGVGILFTAIAARLAAQTRPQRIVSTAPSITEALFALGLGGQVAGVSQFCDFPPEVRKLPKVGTYVKPDAEAIARLAPDLVILQRTSSELTDRLNALQIRFIEVPHGTLDDVFTGIQLIAKAAGVPERAAGVVNPIKRSLNATRAKANSLPSPSVLVIVDRRQGALSDLVAVGPDNYVNQILEIAGGTNVLAKRGLPQYPHISLETVLRENPDVILDLSGTQESEAERGQARAGTLSLWSQHAELTAVRRRHVYVGTSDSLFVPGPRTVEAVQRLFDFIHGQGSDGQGGES